ncbi:hypothetical protein Pcinc_036338 [Petrolisthes cinctipes]|uniref:Uncharacterized protein n=1 Tax=Petrolisthes cinctipes TaxID=88211 RepID=A0AAE1BY12_PETCI|nr:hypothetical protein Pcinc_036338 [Petrolisthes cinctipes]
MTKNKITSITKYYNLLSYWGEPFFEWRPLEKPTIIPYTANSLHIRRPDRPHTAARIETTYRSENRDHIPQREPRPHTAARPETTYSRETRDHIRQRDTRPHTAERPETTYRSENRDHKQQQDPRPHTAERPETT